jgi:hypothetical protein
MMESDWSNEKGGLATGSDGHTVPAVTDTTLARETILYSGPQNRNRRTRQTALVGENHWYTQVHSDLRRDRTRKWSHVS